MINDFKPRLLDVHSAKAMPILLPERYIWRSADYSNINIPIGSELRDGDLTGSRRPAEFGHNSQSDYLPLYKVGRRPCQHSSRVISMYLFRCISACAESPLTLPNVLRR